MAYSTEELYIRATSVIKENNNVYFIEDVCALIGVSKSSFYDHFPTNSDESNDIKELLTKNKISKKIELRERLSKGDKAAEILALYKLIGTEEERKKLSSTYHDLTTKGDSLKPNYSNLTNEEIVALKTLQEKL